VLAPIWLAAVARVVAAVIDREAFGPELTLILAVVPLMPFLLGAPKFARWSPLDNPRRRSSTD
jgi:hypothetical protein